MARDGDDPRVSAPPKDLSIVVCAHDLRRELPRTVRSLSPPYQLEVDPQRVEIIVVDNGSNAPIAAQWFEGIEAEVTVLRFEPATPSPCGALNAGVAVARGTQIAVFVDGARMASPGLLVRASAAMRTGADVFVATMGFHLGPDMQQVSLANGYSPEVEDRLLSEIDWERDGYRMFEICTRAASHRNGVLAEFPETTAFVMHRASFERLGGFNENFRHPGGGLANFDFYERVFNDAAISPVVLIGEGTFHQAHGGATTAAGGVGRRETPDGPTIWENMVREFETVVGRAPLSVRQRKPLLFGRCESTAAENCFFSLEPR
jgi:glycosyltransferase involved in cell wall biosynthesis